MTPFQRCLLASPMLVAAAVSAGPALADELRDALTMAYQSNPTLNAARASQRAVDEGVPIARAAGLPSLSGTASFTDFVKKSALSTSSPDRAVDVQANLSVPI